MRGIGLAVMWGVPICLMVPVLVCMRSEKFHTFRTRLDSFMENENMGGDKLRYVYRSCLV